MGTAYEFRIAGRLSQELLLSFYPSRSHTDVDDTVFVRQVLDDSELFGVIARCQTLRLHLIGLRQLQHGDPSAERTG